METEHPTKTKTQAVMEKNYDQQSTEESFEGLDPAEVEVIRKRMKLVAVISEILEAEEMSPEEFAKVIKAKPQTVRKWLRGTLPFSIDTLFKIEQILKIEIIPFRWNDED